MDGACPGNGKIADKSACGVYLGPLDCPDGFPRQSEQDNLAWRVPYTPGYAHTNQRAELQAALGAPRAARQFVVGGGQWPSIRLPYIVNHVVIKSDSAYLVNSATDYLGNWVENGWRTAAKQPVLNQDLWKSIVWWLWHLEGLGAVVDFWHVPREQNKEADRLANHGLTL